MITNSATSKSLSWPGKIVLLVFGLVLLPALPKLAAGDDGDPSKPRDARRDGDRPTERERVPDNAAREAKPRGERAPADGSTDDRSRGRGERTRDARPPQPPAERSGAGTFVRLERGAMLLSDDENDKDVRVAIDDATKIVIDDKPATLRDLRAGMPLKASEEDGVTTIQAKRPRWLKSLMPTREGDARVRDGAAGRGRTDTGTRSRGDTDPRTREDVASAREGDKPRDATRAREGARLPETADKARDPERPATR